MQPQANSKVLGLRYKHRMKYEATAKQAEEQRRVTQSNRRVCEGDVTAYDSATRSAKVRLPGQQIISGRVMGRGSPVGSKVNITVPLGSGIATIMTPEPRC